MLQQDTPDDYVIATGETNTVQRCVEVAFDQAGIANWQDYVQIDDQFKRPAEVDLLVGRPRRRPPSSSAGSRRRASSS